MLEVEVFDRRSAGSAVPSDAEVRRLCVIAAQAAGVAVGHLAVEFVDAERIARLNRAHRNQARPTDVLSFPVDGVEPLERRAPAGARELGDVVICPEHAGEVREAVIHGVLHLLGFDHEADDGEMLALQRRLLAAKGP